MTAVDDLNATLSPSRRSWLDSANDRGSDFPIQNLPFGIFSTSTEPRPRPGVALGDMIVDLGALALAGLIAVIGTRLTDSLTQSTLNAFVGLGRDVWRSVRVQLSSLFALDNALIRDNAVLRNSVLIPQWSATMHLPVDIPGYTDFYSSREHATHVGMMFRDPKNALLPNWLEIPIGYNGRASSVVVSGTPVRRPRGQLKLADLDRPVLAACGRLDIELETGFIVGKGNLLGEPIACETAEAHIFGMVLLNDWSARDIQQWEYVPLGPFNSKGFATTISPWIVTLDALEPFRVKQPEQDPLPLPYLRHAGKHAFDIHLNVELLPGNTTEATTITRTNFKYMYWTMAQQLAHHTSSGCNTRVGDLMGSGTISGPTKGSYGSLLELTWGGKEPIALNGGGTRTFIEDGDTVTLTGQCQGAGYKIGFGMCTGTIRAALDDPAHGMSDA